MQKKYILPITLRCYLENVNSSKEVQFCLDNAWIIDVVSAIRKQIVSFGSDRRRNDSRIRDFEVIIAQRWLRLIYRFKSSRFRQRSQWKDEGYGLSYQGNPSIIIKIPAIEGLPQDGYLLILVLFPP